MSRLAPLIVLEKSFDASHLAKGINTLLLRTSGLTYASSHILFLRKIILSNQEHHPFCRLRLEAIFSLPWRPVP